MKYIYLNKKLLFNILGLLILSLLFLLFIIPTKNNNTCAINTFKPLDTIKTNSLDLNADGYDEKINIVTKNDTDDIEIIANNHTYYLSSLCNNNILSTHSSFWPLNIYIQKLSRNLYPDIIVQGNVNNKPINYIFTWKDNNFVKVTDIYKNILGLININTTKTSECCALNSFSGLSSFSSFMVINESPLDITKDSTSKIDIEKIQQFINLVENQYELNELPDIFTEEISKDELSLLWTLDKENNTYSFQNGFFYDESINTEKKITSYKWNLNFEKYSTYDNSKSQITIFLLTELYDDDTYKISSFYMK